jgi:hypothetical protein
LASRGFISTLVSIVTLLSLPFVITFTTFDTSISLVFSAIYLNLISMLAYIVAFVIFGFSSSSPVALSK